MSDKKLTEMEIFTSALYNALGIEILRLDYAILTRDDGKGYYLPETTDAGRADAKRWSKRQDRRVQAIRAAQAGALKFATGWKEPKGIYGQISMFRDGG